MKFEVWGCVWALNDVRLQRYGSKASFRVLWWYHKLSKPLLQQNSMSKEQHPDVPGCLIISLSCNNESGVPGFRFEKILSLRNIQDSQTFGLRRIILFEEMIHLLEEEESAGCRRWIIWMEIFRIHRSSGRGTLKCLRVCWHPQGRLKLSFESSLSFVVWEDGPTQTIIKLRELVANQMRWDSVATFMNPTNYERRSCSTFGEWNTSSTSAKSVGILAFCIQGFNKRSFNLNRNNLWWVRIAQPS